MGSFLIHASSNSSVLTVDAKRGFLSSFLFFIISPRKLINTYPYIFLIMRLLTDFWRIAAETTIILNVFQLSTTYPSVYFSNVLKHGQWSFYFIRHDQYLQVPGIQGILSLIDSKYLNASEQFKNFRFTRCCNRQISQKTLSRTILAKMP